jgi:nicotinamidase-related amidase
VPLVRREDSVLVVVDAQPGFFAYEALSEDDAARAADAVTRIAWMAGLAALRATGRGTAVLVGFETDVCVAQSAIGLVDLGLRAVVPEDAVYTNSAVEHERGIARMTGAGVERSHCKGLTFEWLHTVDRALETFPQAAALGTPPWRL